MAEEKILIPSYKRTDSCARCGADIYSPDLKQKSGWPLMSACVCQRGPKIMRAEMLDKLERETAELRLEEQAQAA